uniref:Uncharacterized protein n=1 Tax=Brassica campestris TaxID=3711 RepID=M4D7D1_BRACM
MHEEEENMWTLEIRPVDLDRAQRDYWHQVRQSEMMLSNAAVYVRRILVDTQASSCLMQQLVLLIASIRRDII